jgi:hypothetical protein
MDKQDQLQREYAFTKILEQKIRVLRPDIGDLLLPYAVCEAERRSLDPNRSLFRVVMPSAVLGEWLMFVGMSEKLPFEA